MMTVLVNLGRILLVTLFFWKALSFLGGLNNILLLVPPTGTVSWEDLSVHSEKLTDFAGILPLKSRN